ncbi:MAG TPA: putative sulfate exporter family transporter, partial [Tepidisphaeraceae bacterium]|nr:putative sulfate exporter family transporter [Tepidisphaeraceae bacterium]
PPVGTALGLTQVQFGTWAGVAIHDVSAVVAASARYGDEAMRVATAVKLSRTLWILPVAAVAAYLCRDRGTTADGGGAATPARKATAAVPWFIGVFLLASAGRTLVPAIGNVAPTIATVAKAGLAMTLFLVGTSLSVQCLRTVGWRPLVQAAVLWASISGASLAAVVVMW